MPLVWCWCSWCTVSGLVLWRGMAIYNRSRFPMDFISWAAGILDPRQVISSLIFDSRPHLGEGRSFVANAVKLFNPFFDGDSIDVRLHSMFSEYRMYCKINKRAAYASRFNAQLFNLAATEFPKGSWTKGSFTTSLMKWFEHWMMRRRNQFPPGSLLVKTVSVAICWLFICCRGSNYNILSFWC